MDFLTMLRGALTPRNLAKGALYFLFPVFLLASCTKNGSPNVAELVEESTPEVSAPSDAPSLSEKDVPALLADEMDKENHVVNQVLHLFALAVREAAADPELYDYIKRAMDADRYSFGVAIPELARQNPGFEQLVSRVLSENLDALGPEGVEGEGQELIDALAAKMWKSGFLYLPVIHQHAQEEVTPRYQDMIVAIGEGVNDDDDVVAYLNGSSTAFLMSEAYANSSSANIIFVDPGKQPPADTERVIPVGKDAISLDGNEVEERTTRDFAVDRFRITNGHHYESGNNRKSEVVGWILNFFMTDSPQDPIEWVNFQSVNPKKVIRGDINASNMLEGPHTTIRLPTTRFNNGVLVFIGAFEYYWYATHKSIANPCIPVGQNVVGRRRFSHEWYFFDCGQANLWWPSVNSSRTFQNQKCRFDVRRRI